MSSDGEGRRRIKLTAEVIVEVLDETALERDAAQAVETTQLVDRRNRTTQQVRAAEVPVLTGDAAAAVQWLAEPDSIINSPYVDVVETTLSAEEVDESGQPVSVPDFGRLFPVCGCGRDSCDACSNAFTPRTAAVLWTVADFLSDQAYQDVVEHGDEPVSEDAIWSIFDEYPRCTWRQDAIWRRQAARSFDDLTADIAVGDWPQPRCPAEEMALHLMLQYAKTAVADEWAGLEGRFAGLPRHATDLHWDDLFDLLFLDLDILNLFDAELDGIEDPDSGQNKKIDMGDYRPQAWFTTFHSSDKRDPRRPFRR